MSLSPRWLLVGVLLFGTASKYDRLEPQEKVHFDALRVWMSDKDEKDFFKQKTPEARDQWLKDHRLWDRFYHYDKEMQDAIVQRAVARGWPVDAVYMAWGKPHETQRLFRDGAERSEKLMYFLEVTEDGHVLVWKPGSSETHNAVDRYRYELIVDDGIVTIMTKRAGWE